MGRRRVFRVGGYVSTTGGQFAARLEPVARDFAVQPERAEGTSLWSGVHDEGVEGLRRALIQPVNLELLRTLADQEQGELDWAMSEVGGTGDIDVAALLREPQTGHRRLLLTLCEPAGATKPSVLRALYIRALRHGRATIENMHIAPPSPELVLVLLAGWRAGMERPVARHRPGWKGEAVPLPAWWGYLPFRQDQEEYVLVGPWAELDSQRGLAALERRNYGWLQGELKGLLPSKRPQRSIEFRLDLGQGSELVFLLDRGPFRARLRLMAPKHRRALLPATKEDYHVRRVRLVREAAYEGRWSPTGWDFMGETIEQGCPWMIWQWAKAEQTDKVDWVTASNEADRFAITLKMFIAGT